MIVWRDSKTIPTGLNGPYACGSVNRPAWFPLSQTRVVAFDEQENPQDLCFTGDVVSPPLGGAQTCFSLEAQRVSLSADNVIAANPAPAAEFGWLLLELDTTVSGVAYPSADPSIAQAWVTTIMRGGSSSKGLKVDQKRMQSVGIDAVTIQCACKKRPPRQE